MKSVQVVSPVEVLSPVGFPPRVVGKAMCPRLNSIEGKTIGLLDCRFDQSDIVLDQIAAWITEHYPSVTLRRVQMAAPLQPDPDAVAEIARISDAVIAAVGHCSTCSPGVANQVMHLETEYGIPAVGVQSIFFKRLIDSHLRAIGMPTLRMGYMPHPIVSRTPEELRAYVEGVDQVTGRPYMDELLGALTRPLDGADRAGLSFEREELERLSGSNDNEMQQKFLDNGWTDFMPITLPTEERVEAMLAGTSRGRDEIVQYLRPTGFREAWAMTVERVAVNAVMAGARPEYLPVILGLVATGKSALSSSTASFGSFGFVNGPIRDEIAMNRKIGAIGPWSHANMTIGRAFGLASRNGQGGSVPGLTYMGSLGNVYSNVVPVFPENEEDSPYEPFHVQHGFEPQTSTATVFIGCWYTGAVRGLRPERWREVMTHALRGGISVQAPTLIIDPVLARLFCDYGLDTKEKLIDFVYDAAQIPAGDYWATDDAQTVHRPAAKRGVEPCATNAKAAPDELVHMWGRDQIAVVVTGGSTMAVGRFVGSDYATFSGGATSEWGERKTTVAIDEWR